MEVCFITTFVLFFSAPILLPYQNIKKYDDQMEFIFFFLKEEWTPLRTKAHWKWLSMKRSHMDGRQTALTKFRKSEIMLAQSDTFPYVW